MKHNKFYLLCFIYLYINKILLSMKNNNYDVIISGAGPSGAILGYLLANKGINTLILEKESFPRYKVCAGGIQWKALKILPFNIDSIIEKKISGIYFSRKLKDVFYKKYHDDLIYTVDRQKFDNFIVKNAIKSGCSINFKEKVLNFEIENSIVKVNTNENTYFSKILVGADGAESIVFKKLNSNIRLQKIIGYEIEEPITDFSLINDFNDNILLDFTGVKKGYLWIFPKREYLSIGDGGPVKDALNIKRYLVWFLKNFPDAFFKKNFNFEIKSKIKAHFIPVRGKNNFLNGYRVIVIGDAAGFGDGFTGEGLHNAFLSSNIAFESIVNALNKNDYYFIDYFNNINDKIIRNINLSLIISKIFFSSPSFYYKLIKNNDNLFNSCAKILRGEKTYSDVVNKLKLIKI